MTLGDFFNDLPSRDMYFSPPSSTSRPCRYSFLRWLRSYSRFIASAISCNRHSNGLHKPRKCLNGILCREGLSSNRQVERILANLGRFPTPARRENKQELSVAICMPLQKPTPFIIVFNLNRLRYEYFTIIDILVLLQDIVIN